MAKFFGPPVFRLAQIDKSRRQWYDEAAPKGDLGAAAQAVRHSLEKGGEADGKQALGASPPLSGVSSHYPCGNAVHIPKSVLTARLSPSGQLK